MQALAQAIGRNTSITNLFLNNNDLGALPMEAMQALVEAIGRNTSITRLDLGGNNLGALPAEAMQGWPGPSAATKPSLQCTSGTTETWARTTRAPSAPCWTARR